MTPNIEFLLCQYNWVQLYRVNDKADAVLQHLTLTVYSDRGNTVVKAIMLVAQDGQSLTWSLVWQVVHLAPI